MLGYETMGLQKNGQKSNEMILFMIIDAVWMKCWKHCGQIIIPWGIVESKSGRVNRVGLNVEH